MVISQFSHWDLFPCGFQKLSDLCIPRVWPVAPGHQIPLCACRFIFHQWHCRAIKPPLVAAICPSAFCGPCGPLVTLVLPSRYLKVIWNLVKFDEHLESCYNKWLGNHLVFAVKSSEPWATVHCKGSWQGDFWTWLQFLGFQRFLVEPKNYTSNRTQGIYIHI